MKIRNVLVGLLIIMLSFGLVYAKAPSKMTRAEKKIAKKAARQLKRKNLLAKYDTNKDGKLSRAEKKNIKNTAKRQKRQRMLKKYDANGDGKLSKAEKKIAKKTEKAKRKAARKLKRQKQKKIK
jgi:Ca2+-binding EF-hand superfamily protein